MVSLPGEPMDLTPGLSSLHTCVTFLATRSLLTSLRAFRDDFEDANVSSNITKVLQVLRIPRWLQWACL